MYRDRVLTPREAAAQNVLALAFLGDGVYSLLVREKLVAAGDRKAGALHAESAALVNASAQAQGYGKIREFLREDEADVYRRARNAHSAHTPKNMSGCDYHSATGLEAVFGYLYLCGADGRIRELFDIIMNGKDITE
ncbi:MAG: ribonuclease III [Clostridia bacterium]|nr:ribonuclease III [Clostridia bacterium]MBR5427124.1 ribonuclease III [Clostridia bacterium]